MSDEATGVLDLSAFDEAYEQVEVKDRPQFDNSPVPNGKYTVETHKVEFKHWPSKNEKPARDCLNWTLRVVDGDYKNRFIFKSHNLDKDSLGFLKNDLYLLGYKGKLGNLKDNLESLLHKTVKISQVPQKNNAQYSNVYFNELVEAGSADAPAGTDDIPF